MVRISINFINYKEEGLRSNKAFFGKKEEIKKK